MAGRKIGYARVSREEQDLEMQMIALKAAGVKDEHIFFEKKSGAKAYNRPEWQRCLESLKRGDTLYVYRLDRISRDLCDFAITMRHCSENGITIQSTSNGFDDTTPEGRLLLNIQAVFAVYEREVTIQRTKDGQAKARANGKKIGRPTKITPEMWDRILHYHHDLKLNMPEISRRIRHEFKPYLVRSGLKISPTNLWNHGKAIKAKTPFGTYFKTENLKVAA